MDFHKNQKATYKKQLFDLLMWTGSPVSHLSLKLRCRVVVTTVKIRRKFIDNVTQLLPQRFLTGLLFNFCGFRFTVVNRNC